MEQRFVTQNRPHSTDSPLWFLAGLWLGSTGVAQGCLVFIGVVTIVGIFISGSILYPSSMFLMVATIFLIS